MSKKTLEEGLKLTVVEVEAHSVTLADADGHYLTISGEVCLPGSYDDLDEEGSV